MTIIQEIAVLHKQIDHPSNKEYVSVPLLAHLELLIEKYSDSPEDILHTYVKRLDNTIWNRKEYLETLRLISGDVDPENMIDSFKSLNKKTSIRIRCFLGVIIHNFEEYTETEEFYLLCDAEFSGYMAFVGKKKTKIK